MTKQSVVVFGEVPAVAPGHEFENRLALWGAGVHRQTQAGISALRGVGAESIVLSGAYEDDEDYGNVIIYTGKGSRSQETGQQVAHQVLAGANLELARNQSTGLPVRVIRKVKEPGVTFYRYSGLYRVASFWQAIGKSGFEVWRFRLEALAPLLVAEESLESVLPLFDTAQEPAAPYASAVRRETKVLRIVRDTAVSRLVKQLHDYQCQVCDLRLEGPVGFYAEAAHIQPLGTPHHGPDILSNVLCLCPNHHVLFDLGSFTINDDLSLLGLTGQLRTLDDHGINSQFLRYHQAHLYHPAPSNLR
ncbi:YDG/SRA domain-containing protein [Hymenobacter guriensis]|uniref:HNH endonuclease n=1 Tax=Hymenobacter guriensis TaxID=2793065 RepID=A0ABS0KY00_9BACT|nr:YDG/SRA domain-containing protein [Hymenobacter guriensis]MBG8552724.1 HNH endonuclease [Hymenobacter guriensis]